MASRDYYEVLGVSRDATADDIRQAYHKLAKRYHPDVAKSPEAAAFFLEIRDAYQVLSDPEKRLRYDTGSSVGVESPGNRASAELAKLAGDLLGELRLLKESKNYHAFMEKMGEIKRLQPGSFQVLFNAMTLDGQREYIRFGLNYLDWKANGVPVEGGAAPVAEKTKPVMQKEVTYPSTGSGYVAPHDEILKETTRLADKLILGNINPEQLKSMNQDEKTRLESELKRRSYTLDEVTKW